jgi:chemotaxis protein MotA
MDVATLFGLVAGLAMVIGAIMLGGTLRLFFDVHAVMIVFGGTLAATCVNFPFEEVLQALAAGFKIFTSRQVKDSEVIGIMVRLAEISRREGLLSLQNVVTKNIILKKACQLIADNADHKLIRETLLIEIASLERRHAVAQTIFKRLGLLTPALGLMGTLIGLVQMFSRLDDPKLIGPAMSVAMICTFYGSVLSTLIFTPIGGKLAARTLQEQQHLEIIFEGAKCILENNNPRLVYEKLSSFLPPRERKTYG